MTASEVQALSELRLEEAKALLFTDHFDGCVYLCGYVIELALKAVICKNLKVEEFPREPYFETHDFERLLLRAGFSGEPDPLPGPVRNNMNLVTTWNLRFATVDAEATSKRMLRTESQR